VFIRHGVYKGGTDLPMPKGSNNIF